MLTIYSVGDAWYLGKVMDAIAMISGSNEGFVGASMVAALIGVFVIGFQSILKITLNIHELLVCYIIYMGCFSIQTDVVIESVYSDKTVIQKDINLHRKWKWLSLMFIRVPCSPIQTVLRVMQTHYI